MPAEEEFEVIRMQLQTDIRCAFEEIEEYHPKSLNQHTGDFERLAERLNVYIQAHPEVLEEYKHNREETIQKLKEKLYH